MKMLMVICPRARRDEVRKLIAGHNVHAHTEMTNVTGEGTHGIKLGTHVWPDTSVLMFSVLAPEKVEELLMALAEFKNALYPEEGLRAFVLPVEHMI